MKNNNEILDRIKTQIAEIKAKREAMIAEIRPDFPKMFAHIFEQSELIDSFTWRQYTPFFNDGEECYFSVNSSVYINDTYTSELDWYDWAVKYEERHAGILEGNPEVNIKESQLVYQIEKIIDIIPSDIMEDLFGNHVKVTINRNGSVEVEDYEEHD
jgi:hypothetical protein